MFFDSHAHLTADSVYPHIDSILNRAKEAGISHIANICTDPQTLERGLILAERYPWVYNVGATTPHDVEKEGSEAFPIFEKAARCGKLAAIGETGLDYHYEHSPKEIQQEYLKRYFALAQEVDLGVVIHCREAFDDLFALADRHYEKTKPLVLHCFTGTLDEAKEVIKRGWYLSLSGIVTFKRSEVLREVAKLVPLPQLLIETDTPYLAPMPYRGKPNEPAYVTETA
ncbi:MAG TPA: YchF/TatD family DNA exonuclease, partial [Chlamydiales bacterium]|nr:YchF/TatD family DNA exonuclease [Chlamydiales bacterium]